MHVDGKKNDEENKKFRGSKIPNDESGVNRVLESVFLLHYINFQEVLRMNARTQRTTQMMELPNCAVQFSPEKFSVRSQNTPQIHYIVSKTDNGLVCDCPDHTKRKSDCKHIKTALELIRKNEGQKQTFRIMERSLIKVCKFCDSGNIIKKGLKKNKNSTMQMFKCKDCKRRFTANFGFEHRQFDHSTITGAMQMYYSGMSVRDISNHYEMIGIEVNHSTIYRWIDKYSKITVKYLNGIVPRVGDWFRADEVWIKINGKQNYLFASMDDDTRYWPASDIADNKFQHNADNLLQMTKQQAGKTPKHFITDKLPAYMKSSKRVFGKKTHHTANAGIRSKRTGQKFHPSNNKMERLNGEIRDREKVFRGLKKMDTAILDGMRVYYNFIKKHGSLKGRTPAQASMIEVDGKNKWKTIIQNASLNTTTE